MITWTVPKVHSQSEILHECWWFYTSAACDACDKFHVSVSCSILHPTQRFTIPSNPLIAYATTSVSDGVIWIILIIFYLQILLTVTSDKRTDVSYPDLPFRYLDGWHISEEDNCVFTNECRQETRALENAGHFFRICVYVSFIGGSVFWKKGWDLRRLLWTSLSSSAFFLPTCQKD